MGNFPDCPQLMGTTRLTPNLVRWCNPNGCTAAPAPRCMGAPNNFNRSTAPHRTLIMGKPAAGTGQIQAVPRRAREWPFVPKPAIPVPLSGPTAARAIVAVRGVNRRS